jgi:hypothetical protein
MGLLRSLVALLGVHQPYEELPARVALPRQDGAHHPGAPWANLWPSDPRHLFSPLLLEVSRKAEASRQKVIWWFQPYQLLTSYSSSPMSLLLVLSSVSIGRRAAATLASVASGVSSGALES